MSAFGEGSSIAMSVARQSAMLAQAGLSPVLAALKWPDTTERQAFRTLNGRHRQHLIVKALMQGVSVDFTPALLAGVVTTATLNCNTLAPTVTLTLDKGNSALWERQIAQVLAQRWHRPERIEEIVLQQSDILSFLTLGLPVAGDTHPWLTTLLDAVFEMAFRVVAEMKHAFAMPRPHELSPDVAPVIRTPSHGSFPSGHATEAFAAAAVLSAVFPDRAPHLRQMAARIAMNRSFGGVHFPIDHYAGAMLGDALGGLAARRALGLNIFKDATVKLALQTSLPEVTATLPALVPPLVPALVFEADVTVERFAHDSPVLQMPAPAGPAPSGVLAHLADLVRDEL
ncbi:phosphatase PAP2 family protein [Rhodobacter ferrooxidans]|nr:phosphatase PAP2 family protein [Rhodobacter sp. SW2]